jgi:hypothetical protein
VPTARASTSTLHGDGSQSRCSCHVADLDAIVRSVVAEQPGLNRGWSRVVSHPRSTVGIATGGGRVTRRRHRAGESGPPVPRRSWTDDDLRAAIADATTWAEVLRELGASRGGSPRAAVKRRAAELGLATDHVRDGTGGVRRRTWSDDDLRAAVATSSNLRQVFLALGLKVGGGSWVGMKQHVLRLGIDTSHWDAPVVEAVDRPRQPLPEWTDEQVLDAADGARSVAEVMRRLGLDPVRKRGRAAIEQRLDELGIDRSGFVGQAWRRGVAGRSGGPRGRPLEQVLVRGSTYTSTSSLKKRLIAEGVLERRCGGCGLVWWRGRLAPLHLDHRNGDRTDNRVENLRLLCPNCHAQTDTYCGRNIRRR